MHDGTNLYVFYPHWQGAGSDDTVHRGAVVLRNQLAKKHGLHLVDVNVEIDGNENANSNDNILNATALVQNHHEATKLFKKRKPMQIFTLGGDCGMELAPISWLNTQRQDFAVVWFDAHADINSPESSPSKTFHGMVLRNLIEGKDVRQTNAFPSVDPNRLVLAGVRDLDPPEARYIEERNIGIVSCDEIANTNGQCLAEILAKRGYKDCYVHIDPDVLSLQDFDCTTCPTPNGIKMDVLEEAVKDLRRKLNVIGGSLQEVTAVVEDKPVVSDRLCRLFALLTGHEPAI